LHISNLNHSYLIFSIIVILFLPDYMNYGDELLYL
jgi:hypothetical protein